MTADGEIIEGTALEPYQPAPPPPALFGTSDPVEVVQRAAAVADALKDVIAQRHLFSAINGREHVKVEGWQLLGSMLGVTAVCVATEPVENGWKATVEARTADGRVIGRADAVCTTAEKRWKGVDDYARLSMAQTRATSKALKGPLGFVISMAGYQTTPEEEMLRDESPEPKLLPALPFGPKYEEATGKVAGAACVKLVGGDPQRGIALWKLIANELGYMPQAAAIALVHAADTENIVPDIEAPEL